ncbi:UDP-N-acetylmuramate dehydrogenase [Microaerobacter geothermalis]|uniref:UDP-N-acetylmuramate dehydrogenase n=1 Tax=Microaerobacter geothermalis TaxID=674972 RepID=UPI001F47A686|nr:UDP-N-acetylmuramate dehydrogenase [Microaerobacter geothermalis]MCF6093606.1 UDP-N-acetylmuramate dehydrogenase [Microaerobacter geothermalis]
MKDLISFLQENQVGEFLLEEPMSNHTTWQIGGPVDILIIPHDQTGLQKILKFLHQTDIPWTVIGRGSNLLVRDKGIRGAVIKLSHGFENLRFLGETVRVGAGYSFIKLAVMAGKEGLTGLEFAGGIPGTVGGAIYMNAGAHGSDVSRILVTVKIVKENGEPLTLTTEDLKFQYRNSILQQKKWVVVEADFQLKRGNRKEIAAAMALHKDKRRKSQPLQFPCAGSVFKNPENYYAGGLIEKAGLKGYRVGDAQISLQHANFIVNCGRATADDVLTLIEHVKEMVKEKFHVELIPEVKVVGEG